MTHVVIIGCGVIGASIAYELSQVPELQVTVIDRQRPAEAATGAALGVLMGIVSQKVKGIAWALRETSMQRYETLIPELEAMTGETVPVNRQGIVKLCLDNEDQPDWEQLIQIRQGQGWRLERWSREQVLAQCPQITSPQVIGAIYSPNDRQIDPTALTLLLVKAAQQRGVTFHFDTPIHSLSLSDGSPERVCQIETAQGAIAADFVVVAAGLGSTLLLQRLAQTIEIRPVLGQAVRLKLEQPLGNPHFQPMITGADIHLVPLGNAEYWVGATVEFPPEQGILSPDADRLQAVLAGAIELCPALKEGKILQQWSGLRPRPYNRPAPIIERLPGFQNVIAATGHYRNGVLLAPATAAKVKAMITAGDTQPLQAGIYL